MNLQVEAPFQVSETLQQLIEEKVDKLGLFYDRITSAHVFFKDEIQRFQKKDQRTVEMRLEVPGSSLHASASEESFEKALIEVAHKLERQIKKYKDTLSSH